MVVRHVRGCGEENKDCQLNSVAVLVQQLKANTARNVVIYEYTLAIVIANP